MSSTILSPLDAEDLRAQGLLHPGPDPRSLRLHRRRFDDGFDTRLDDIPLDIPLNSPLAERAYLTIPEKIISWNTLMFLGLTKAKATELWEQWDNRPADEPSPVVTGPGYGISQDPDELLEDKFLKFMIDLTELQPDVWDQEDDAPWRAYFDACGVSQETQDRIFDTDGNLSPGYIMDPRSETCWEWVSGTMEESFKDLRVMRKASRAREMKLRQTPSLSGSRSGTHGVAFDGGVETSGSRQATRIEVPVQGGGQNADKGTSSRPAGEEQN